MPTRVAVPEGRPNYGYDAPSVMFTLLGVGMALITAGTTIVLYGHRMLLLTVAALVLLAGIVATFLGCCMAAYGFAGKMRMRDHLLGCVTWAGDERVLDVGTGAGLLLIGAAKRLTTGSAIGIDIWSSKDLSNNTRDVTERNIALEGVADRAKVQTGNAIELAFPAAPFDRVVSLLCLHNIEDKAQQEIACREIARVLKPGGTALIGDYVPTSGYAATFKACGLRLTSSKTYFTTALGLMWMVVAEKPA